MSIDYEQGHSPAAVADAFRAMAARATNLRPVLVVQAEVVQKLLVGTFKSESSPDGTPWAKMADKTFGKRRAGKGPKKAKIGVDTGLMRASLVAMPATGPSFIQFGTNRPYAAAFHQGSTAQGMTVDPRPARARAAAKARAKRAAAGKKLRPLRGSKVEFTAQPWTRTQPARPLLPVTPEGALMQSGPAGKAFARIGKSVAKYIATGKIT